MQSEYKEKSAHNSKVIQEHYRNFLITKIEA
jgi:hypothetical protein